ncbi:hypothetical protein RUMOBE_00353 [Blautia obeum ATCC 29174]|uniref:Uncharacterized protein n=1 Tax=Blautia obeum ATCC 29174 TaxID=411459 RepID=A5ZMY7_9FIRM|nr:hypothetical protein RUMOBE_00353 [Blautia obeum ATCC 29174]
MMVLHIFYLQSGNRERPDYLLLSAASGVLCMYIDSAMNETNPDE